MVGVLQLWVCGTLGAPWAGSAAPAGLQESGAAAVLRIVEVDVFPEQPMRDALCRLSLKLENRSSQPIYALGFDVEISGVKLPVYRDQLFLQKLPPGEVSEVKLFNFWTNETGRPLPTDGKVKVVVTLREAEFLAESSEPQPPAEPGGPSDAKESAGPVEVWAPAGPVPGLPQTAVQVVQVRLSN